MKPGHERINTIINQHKSTSIQDLKFQVKSLTSADIPLKVRCILFDILTHLENRK